MSPKIPEVLLLEFWNVVIDATNINMPNKNQLTKNGWLKHIELMVFC